jgi:hypothetical protein
MTSEPTTTAIAREKKISEAAPTARSKYQIFPPLAADRRAALAASIARHGVEHPTVWDDDGNLLEGWEREAICRELGIGCPRVVRQFDCEVDKFRFILGANTLRRANLNGKQKQAVIAAYLGGDPGISDNTLGEALGVSKNTVAKVRHRLEAEGRIPKIEKTRGKDGKLRPVRYKPKRIITNSPAEFRKALEIIKDLPSSCSGKTQDIFTASRRANRTKRKEEQTGRIVPPLPADAIQLYHCPFQELEELASIKPGTINLIATDIPYDGGFLPQLGQLGAFAQRVLADGGLFVCMCGQFYLNQAMQEFGKHLTYRWTLAFEWPGAANRHYALHVLNQWKPVLLFSSGDWQQRPQWSDVIRDCSKEKEWHPWQQPLEVFDQLIRYFSYPGDLVVDPLSGGFTTAEACLGLSRRFIGCDQDGVCVSKGLERLACARNRMELGAKNGGTVIVRAESGSDADPIECDADLTQSGVGDG